MARNKPVRPSRPLLEVAPILHARLKDAAGREGIPLKEFTNGLLENGLLRYQSGLLRFTPARVIESTEQTTLPL